MVAKKIGQYKRDLEAKQKKEQAQAPDDAATGARYVPPYDSPIEDRFAYHLDKYMRASVTLTPQYEIETQAGRFRLDFMLSTGWSRCGVECDGAEFHDDYRDEWRDAMILATGEIDVIYRFRGADLVYDAEHCIALLAKMAPTLFSQRGLINLETLTTDESPDYEAYGKHCEKPKLGRVRSTVRARSELRGAHPPFWKRYIDFVEARWPAPLEQYMAAWKLKKGGGNF